MRRAAKAARSSQESKPTKVNQPQGFNPTLAIATAYTGTFCVYLLGNLLPNLPQLPYPWSECLLPTDHPKQISKSLTTPQIILALMFVFHFCRRAFENVFMQKYVRTHNLFELIGAHIYYWFFAFWMGWSIRVDLGYTPTHMPLFVAGVILFFIGEIGNCSVHIQLSYLRKVKQTKISAPSSRSLPRGALFALVSCPHYGFEILTWIGFFLASMVLASAGLLAATIVVLAMLSMEHHQRYRKDFDGKGGRELYPPSRKALIPFIY